MPDEQSGRFSVFVYGTLKAGGPNHDRFLGCGLKGDAVFRFNAITESRWPLVVASRYSVPYLLDAEGTGCRVSGEVFEVDRVTLDRLDQLEGHPDYYVRSPINVIPLNKDATQNRAPVAIAVDCYVLRRFHPKLLRLPFHESFEFGSSAYPRYIPPDERRADDAYSAKLDVQSDVTS